MDACLALTSELAALAPSPLPSEPRPATATSEGGAQQPLAPPRQVPRVLFAIDDYNALGLRAATGYGVWRRMSEEEEEALGLGPEGRLVRQLLRVEHLTLVGGALRL